ncbi:MAG: NIPSNAP family protein [Nitrospinota bacterium]|nr:NIPSNAP family protein [Nitrospinota bacterium]
MIYELRIYKIKPGTVKEYYEKFHEAFEERQKLSRMIGIFNTEVGDLNKIMHIWEYEDHTQRAETRAKASGYDWWPPPIGDLLVSQTTKIVTTPSFRPEPRLGEFGGIYEVRTYQLLPGKIPNVLEKWTQNLPPREELSPVSAVFMSESGPLNEWIHIWAYKDMNHRTEMRKKASELPNWPPGGRPFFQSQNTEIWVPGPYSLMR